MKKKTKTLRESCRTNKNKATLTRHFTVQLKQVPMRAFEPHNQPSSACAAAKPLDFKPFWTVKPPQKLRSSRSSSLLEMAMVVILRREGRGERREGQTFEFEIDGEELLGMDGLVEGQTFEFEIDADEDAVVASEGHGGDGEGWEGARGFGRSRRGRGGAGGRMRSLIASPLILLLKLRSQIWVAPERARRVAGQSSFRLQAQSLR